MCSNIYSLFDLAYEKSNIHHRVYLPICLLVFAAYLPYCELDILVWVLIIEKRIHEKGYDNCDKKQICQVW